MRMPDPATARTLQGASSGSRDTQHAMSQENVEIVRRFLDRAHADPDRVWGIFDDSVVWEIGPLRIPDLPPTSHGPEQVREFFRRWAVGDVGGERGENVERLRRAYEAFSRATSIRRLRSCTPSSSSSAPEVNPELRARRPFGPGWSQTH